MQQLKLFQEANLEYLTNEVNRFLEENPTIKIIKLTYSSQFIKDFNQERFYVLVHFEKKRCEKCQR